MPRNAPRPRRKALLRVLACGVMLVALLAAAPSLAQAAAPYWSLSSSSAPANLPPGGEGKIIVTASNLGDAVMNVAKTPITITDKLPAGVTAIAVSGSKANQTGELLECALKSATEVSCTDPAFVVEPSTGLKVTITVHNALPSGTTLKNEVLATGGEAPAAAVKQPVRIDAKAPVFGIEKYSFVPEEAGGAPDTRAGSHPFQLTTNLALNQNAAEEPVALPKNLQFDLPPGLIGNPTVIPQCSQVDFTTILLGPKNLCGPETVVGVAEVTIDEPNVFKTGPETRSVPVFNLEPALGEPARFGIVALKVPVVLSTAIRTGKDYGVVVTATNTSQAAGLVSSKVTFWGVPSDPLHNTERGWACIEGGALSGGTKACEEQAAAKEKHEKEEKEKGEEPKPFLSLPTSCSTPWTSPMRAQSWVAGAEYLPPLESEFPLTLGECAPLSLAVTLGMQPEEILGEPGTPETSGSTPSGLTVTANIPQEETVGGLAKSAVRSTTVTLPEGLVLSPAAAGGLQACTALQMGFVGAEERTQTDNTEFSPNPASCPDASKVGTVSIKSPDLKNPLTGFVYVAAQDTNPFEPPLVLYLVAQDPVSGVLVKLAGTVVPNPVTGQQVSVFENTPQVPFEELKLSFFAGDRAPLSTPPLCGPHTATTSIAPWSGNAPATPSASFNITSGPGGGPCPSSPLPFAPSFEAGVTNLQAGAFTGFSLTIRKPDGHQALQTLTMHLPKGLAAILASVTPCEEPQVANNECGPASQIGHSSASSGLGGSPFTLPGKVYLTGPYKKAPFGITVVTPAVAGPFNLGFVTVRSTISVDPNTAAVTITSDPFPTILKGVPVQLKQINVMVDRPNFQFNPTNCNPATIEGTMGGAEGGSAAATSKLQVANCVGLPFVPKLTASTVGQASKANGASLKVNVVSAGLGQANIAKVELQIPVELPSRLTTIQKACPDGVFNVNPATCDEGSVIGNATIHTPVLKNPLSGPAYLVSHGNAAFPDVEFVLQGEGITLVLDGTTDIKKGITYSRFESAPDAPFTTFETFLPTGPHSALGANVPTAKKSNLCGSPLLMPTVITGQNGVVISQTTKIAIEGCGKGGVESFQQKMAKKLKSALKTCKKLKKKKKRVACERAARKKYGPKPKPKGKKK
jgi:hypothetical protein